MHWASLLLVASSYAMVWSSQLPPMIGPDKVLAKQAMAAHEAAGYLLLALIAMHAAAALYHHFVRRDDVPNAMLPSRGCRAPARQSALARQDKAF